MTGEDSEINYTQRARDALGFSRWWQIAAAAAMMAAVSPYQYVWSSIQEPLAAAFDVSLAALGLVFSLHVVFQSLSQFPAGWWRDRNGPRRVTFLAAALAGGGYVGLAYATDLWQLYVLYSVGAVGVGIIYTVAVNTALKWFPDRAGLTTGIGTMAFAAGSAVFIPYVQANATVEGYPAVLRNVGILILGVLVLGAVVLRDPPSRWIEQTDGRATRESDGGARELDRGNRGDRGSDGGAWESVGRRSFTWREVIRTWQFWLLYAMFVAVSGADLLIIAQIVGFAESVGFTTIVATVTATRLPIASGVSWIVVGDVSDRFNRKHVMAASFLLAGVFRILMVYVGVVGTELLFVASVILAMFFSSPLYVLFPSILSDYFGLEHSSSNYALLYSAKMCGGIIGGIGAGYVVLSSGWTTTFVAGGVLATAAGVAAFALRPPKPTVSN
ncbi:OFA family MFS transporter [Halegenticoccus tardaugens]|uniref:OFA family MFS transporter n=1 Tax=Halegenticoccus tardaugens TaxID=2071624 RepID=UPI00100BA6FE|nr:OFA family MFS transporter [Halegenticoccus tardaugens]